MSIVNVFKDRLSQLVATPSVSCTSPAFDMPNLAVVELLANWLSGLGFAAEVIPLAGYPGKANLLASYGSGPGGLVLAGHSDTVPCDPGRWQQNPFSLVERDERFYGLGATDMKGFFPTVLAAIEQIELKNIQQPLMVLATADEESSMSGARALAALGRPKARYAVIGEPTSMRPIRMHKGIMMEAVRIRGRAGHSSDPANGNNALDTMHLVLNELVRVRGELQATYRNDGFTISVPTLNLGCIHGGDNPNRICGDCELQFDLRTLPGMSIDNLHEDLAHRLIPLGEAHGTTVTLDQLFPGINAYEEPSTSELVRVAEKLSGHTAESVAFATEASFLKNMGMETIVMGPGSIDQAHQPNEYIDQSQITPAIDIVKSLIRQFCY